MTVSFVGLCNYPYAGAILTLCRSLEICDNYDFHIYCLDDQATELLRKIDLPNVIVHHPATILTTPVDQLKLDRSYTGFVYSLKPVALLHTASISSNSNWVTYLDSDMLVFGDLASHILHLDIDKSSWFTQHRFSPEFEQHREMVGNYNAGFASFRNDENGIRILSAWRDLCFEWCDDFVDNGRYADQKYLNNLTDRFSNAGSLNHPGINAAPWNVSGAKITRQTEGVYIDKHPLLLYHFQGLKLYGDRLIDFYQSSDLHISKSLRDLVYAPYVESLLRCQQKLKAIDPNWSPPYCRLNFKQLVKTLGCRLLGMETNLYRPRRTNPAA